MFYSYGKVAPMKSPALTQKILVLTAIYTVLTGCEQNLQQYSDQNQNSHIYQPVEYMPRVALDNAEGADGILVKFKSDIGSNNRARSLKAAGLTGSASFSLVPGLTRAEPLPGYSLQDTLVLLANDSTVAYAEPDYLLTSNMVPNDPQFIQQYALDNTNNPASDISAVSAWDITTGSPDVVVAIIDSGVDYNHQDLQANIWKNIDEIPGNGIDDDQNGFIDDIRGWNFNSNNNDPMDDNNHGTHVAGIIGASGNNSIGISGVNWNVKIMPLKFMNSRGQGRTSAAINALEYAVANGARVSNNSWGGGTFSQALFDAIQAANSSGHLFIAAAGNDAINNDRTAHYPSNYNLPNIIAVAATDQNDRLASFSNFGLQTVDIAAPGVSVFSTIRNNQYSLMSGTSMAAPFVSGAVGLILAQNFNLSVIEIKNQLLNNVDPVTSLSNNTVSGGRLNVYSAIKNVSISPTNPTPITNTPAPVSPQPINPVPVNPTPIVPDPVPVTEPVIAAITIAPNVQDVAIGASKQLTATGGVAPYTWTVDNTAYATIDNATGVFKALTVGKVNVVVTDSTGVASDPYVINIISMGILPKSLTQISLNGTIVLTADGGVGPYTWSISDSTIANIQPGGVNQRELTVSPIKPGNFTVTLVDTTNNTAISNVINVAVDPLSVLPQSSDLNVGQTLQLSTNGGTSPYIYVSTNPSVASVDGGGLVNAIAAGTTIIRVTDFNDSIVEVAISVTSISTNAIVIDKPFLLLGVNNTAILIASGGSGNYQWQSSDTTIATVNGSGLVRGVGPGTAIITVSDGTGAEQTATVEIRQINISGPTSVVFGSGNIQLTASGGVAPYTWSTTNTAIAIIDSTGLLTPLSAGSLSVSVADSDGFTATVAITINGSATPPPGTAPTTPTTPTTGGGMGMGGMGMGM